jgi:O-acetyl-ADP-ribose deacetylase (regulator of RNase III)
MAEPDDLTTMKPDKLHVEPRPEPAAEPPSLEARIAELIRERARERAQVTAEWEVRKLEPQLRREELSAALARMAALEEYTDVKAVVAPSGRLYLFSVTHLAAAAAQKLGRIEEAKLAIAERIRADSRKTLLTSAAELAPLFPSEEPGQRADLLSALFSDERFKDIQNLSDAKGEVYYHSDTFISGAYGSIMVRAKANDPALAIAEMVRERARTLPRATRIDLFEDPVFGLEKGDLEAHVKATLAKAEYADIKQLAHPTTGAVYLYSDRWMSPEQAFLLIDWDEVGAAKNP